MARLPVFLIIQLSIKEFKKIVVNHNQKFIIHLIITVLLCALVIKFYDDKKVLISIFATLLLSPVYILVAITTHRLVLAGSNSVPKFGVLSWKYREWRFLGYIFLIQIFNSVILLLVSSSTDIVQYLLNNAQYNYLFWLVQVPGLYVLSRLSVLLPACAIDERTSISWAWNLTKGNGWRLLFVITLFPLFFYKTIEYIPSSNIFVDIIVSSMSFVIILFEITILSISFRYLKDNDHYVIY